MSKFDQVCDAFEIIKTDSVKLKTRIDAATGDIAKLMSAFRNLDDTAHKQMAVRKLKEAQQLGDKNPERVAELISQAKYHLPYAQARTRKDAASDKMYDFSDTKLRAEKEKAYARHSKSNTALINAGRGNERAQETLSKTDPLSKEFTESWNEFRKLNQHEQERQRLGSKFARKHRS